MKKSTSMPLKQYRKQLARERKKGSLAHRRYTFSQCPLLEIDVDEFIVLRPAWVLDRFCGPQLYWQTFFDFGEEKDPRGEQEVVPGLVELEVAVPRSRPAVW